MDKKIIAGGLTQNEIDRLKKKHGSLSLFTINHIDGDIHLWLKKPDMKIISACNKVSQADEIKGAVVLFKNCLVSGPVEIADDAELFMSLLPELQQIMQTFKVEVKKF